MVNMKGHMMMKKQDNYTVVKNNDDEDEFKSSEEVEIVLKEKMTEYSKSDEVKVDEEESICEEEEEVNNKKKNLDLRKKKTDGNRLNLMSILEQAHKVQHVPKYRKRSKSTKPSIAAKNIKQQDIRGFINPMQGNAVYPIITGDLGGSMRDTFDQSGEGGLEPGPIRHLG